MPPERALLWSLNGKNSLDNCYGFSPYQIVFSINPKIPLILNLGPSGLENLTKSEAFSNNLNVLHLARQEFVKAELSSVVKKALKTKIHARGGNIKEQDWIYYLKPVKTGGEKIWRGQAEVVGINGKKVFIDQGVKMATVNKCSKRGRVLGN